MDSYVKESSLQIISFCETIVSNEDVKEKRTNVKSINDEQKSLIKNIRLKLDAMEKKL